MGSKIKRIYTGLPKHLSNEVIWVERKYRLNDLSHQPGGFDIVLEYKAGNVLGYDWIKKPSSYIQQILSNDLSSEEAYGFEALDDAKQLTIAKSLIRTAYARNYQDKVLYESAEFEQVWNSSTSRITLEKALQAYELQKYIPEEITSYTLVESILKNQKASNIQHLIYFLPEEGIINLEFDKTFEIDLSCKEEGDEWYLGDILMKLPAVILRDLVIFQVVSPVSPIRHQRVVKPVKDISFIITEVLIYDDEFIRLELCTPSIIFRTNVDGTKSATKVHPITLKCTISDHGISIMYNGWCFTIVGDTNKWVFS